MSQILTLAFTPGEPAGIGPDLAIKLAQENLKHELIYFANNTLLKERASLLGLKVKIKEYDFNQEPRPNQKYEIKLIDIPLGAKARTGKLNLENSAYVLKCLKQAANYCLLHKFNALITGPVHKGVINEAGFDFTGHTEYLQKLSDCPRVVMLLANSRLKVALATTHLPLSKVSGSIRQTELVDTIDILNASLQRDFAIKKPKILIAGLNPHAGEGGHLGNEEIVSINPAIEQCKSRGINLEGPLAADTMFSQKNLKRTDAFLAMYHDQGLPVLKFAGFGQSANITLGLPFIRTSVDHGTALELAGSAQADIGSLKQAIKQALIISKNHASPA